MSIKLKIDSTIDAGLEDKSIWTVAPEYCCTDYESEITEATYPEKPYLCVQIKNNLSETKDIKVSYTIYKDGKSFLSDSKTKTVSPGKKKVFFTVGVDIKYVESEVKASIVATIVQPACQETCETTCQTFCMALCEGTCEQSCQCKCESSCETEIENTDFTFRYNFDLPSGLSAKAKTYVAEVYSCAGWTQTGTFCYRTRAFFGEGTEVLGSQFKHKIAIQNNTENDMTLQIIEDGDSDSSCILNAFYQYPRPMGSITVKANEITTKEFNPYGIYHDECETDRPTYLEVKWKLTPRRTPPCENYGDLNNDGYVDGTDLTLLGDYLRCGFAQITTPLSESDFKDRADLDKDGEITSDDFNTLACFIAYETDTFPACGTCGNCETTCQTTCEGTAQTCQEACLTQVQHVCDTCETTCEVTCQILEEIECPIMVVSYGTPLVDSLEPLRRIRKILPSLIVKIYYSDLHLKIAIKFRRLLYLPLLILTKLINRISKRH